MRKGESERLAAQLSEGQQYELTNKDLRRRYGLPRVTAGVRWKLAADLKRVGLHVVSDPDDEPLVVQQPGPPPAGATSTATPPPVP